MRAYVISYERGVYFAGGATQVACWWTGLDGAKVFASKEDALGVAGVLDSRFPAKHTVRPVAAWRLNDPATW